MIKQKLYEALGVRVDQVIQGKGTTNTGNLARRCFEEPEKFANALELDETLVSNLALILRAYRCKKELNLKEMKKFSRDTYDLHYSLYSWAQMNPSMHKLLIHGCDIVRQFPMPIAFYAEDASESSHKIYRDTLKNHSRQSNRQYHIEDTFNRMIYLTDPIISMKYIDRRIKMHKKKAAVDLQRFLLNE